MWWIILYSGSPQGTRGTNLLKTPARQPSVIINQSTCNACWDVSRYSTAKNPAEQASESVKGAERESYWCINTGTSKVQSTKITDQKHMFSLKACVASCARLFFSSLGFDLSAIHWKWSEFLQIYSHYSFLLLHLIYLLHGCCNRLIIATECIFKTIEKSYLRIKTIVCGEEFKHSWTNVYRTFLNIIF